MFIETIPVGVFQCNCSVLACEKTRKAVVIDPGDEANRILRIIRGNKLDVIYVVHTHAHLDHIMGTFKIIEATGAIARLHDADRLMWERVSSVAESYDIPTPRLPMLGDYLKHNEVIRFGRERLTVIHTPGHTPGSCSFAYTSRAHPKTVWSGDTLFRGKIGIRFSSRGRRFDLTTIITSIRNRLLSFEDDTLVIPGHGPATQIGFERRNNPFLMSLR